MNSDYLVILKRMNTLIRLKATGSPRQFAERLEIGESTLYKYISTLKCEFGAPVAYDSQRESYYYRTEGELKLGFQNLHHSEAIKTVGGLQFIPILSIIFQKNNLLYTA